MIKILAVVLFILMYIIGGERGVISIIALAGNIYILLLSIMFMYYGINPILVTFIGCLIINSITLFYQSGKNAKTYAAFISVLIVIALLFLVILKLGYCSDISGFNEIQEKQDSMMELSTDINLNMMKIAVCVIIIGLIGAVMDTAIAVSSTLYEVYKNNKHLSLSNLLKTGIKIGRGLLATTINTLFFAYISENLLLFDVFGTFNYSFLRIINSKAFYQGFCNIIISAIGCIIIVPINAFIISYIMKNPNKYEDLLKEDLLFIKEDDKQAKQE